MKKWWIVPAIMIGTIILGLIGAAWSYRPIVEYTLLDYPESFDTAYDSLGLWVSTKNTGLSYAPLRLVLEVKNGNITLWSLEQGMVCNGTHLIIHYDLPSEMENYVRHYVGIKPIGDPENITVNLEYENLADWSIPKGFICQFLEPHGFATSVRYEKTDTTTYELAP